MGIDLGGLEVGDIIIRPFTRQDPVHAIINIGPEDKRNL